MQSFILDRHTDPSNPVMKVTQDDKIPIYDSKADAEADLANIEEGAIVATKDTGATEKIVDVVQDGNMNPVTSNAVADTFQAPDYSHVSGANDTFTATEAGFINVMYHGGNSGNTTSMGCVIKINNQVYFEWNWGNGTPLPAFVFTTPMIPISKGDVVTIIRSATVSSSTPPAWAVRTIPVKHTTN